VVEVGVGGAPRDWRGAEFLTSCSLTLMEDEGICGRFGRFDDRMFAYRLTSFGDDVSDSFTVLRLRYFGN